jgi:hypothetical protein
VLLPEAAGPHDPATTTVARRAGSIRRTSSIDSSRPDGLAGGVVVVARARDLVTDHSGASTVVARAELRLQLEGMSRTILSIEATPWVEGLDALVGLAVGPGFRSRVNEALPGEQSSGSLLYLLLDDLPGAALVSGYALQRTGLFDTPIAGAGSGSTGPPATTGGSDPDGAAPPTRQRVTLTAAQLPAVDLCAGWAGDSAMMDAIRATGVIPTPMGPAAPALERADDPDGWHAMDPLGPFAMRRRRRLDVVADHTTESTHRLDVHFRDSHMDPDGEETVVHEYSLDGTVDAARGRVVTLTARAHVLPWMECPGALASAGRLVGAPLDGLRSTVRRDFKGTSTCTHLNDMLRSLSDVGALVAELGTGPTTTG